MSSRKNLVLMPGKHGIMRNQRPFPLTRVQRKSRWTSTVVPGSAADGCRESFRTAFDDLNAIVEEVLATPIAHYRTELGRPVFRERLPSLHSESLL